MKRYLLLLGGVLLLGAGCSSGIEIAHGGPGEKLLWSSQPERPTWTIEEPSKKDKNLLFVGVSDKYSSETDARKKAFQDATNKIANYLGSLAQTRYEKAVISLGLSSKAADSTIGSRDYYKQISSNLVRRVRPQKWYIEQWRASKGNGWKVFVLASVPVEEINESFHQAARKRLQEIERKGSGEESFKKLLEFWKTMAGEEIIN
ncbi:MAG: hypothetical protein ACE5GM_01070 [bacterium]